MRQFFIIVLILSSFVFSFGQEAKPLTQAEYVKMLYEVEKKPSAKQDLIDAIRRRGIGFQLNDGVRSLTRSKSRNDADLKRTLEEAERRRQNPSAAKLPSEKDASEILEKTRKNNLAAVEEMPDFVVKQQIQRSEAFAGTNNWKSIDRLVIAVSYSSEKGEQYKVLAINGSPVNATQGSNYGGLSGATTGGEFVEHLAKIFKPESKTEFQIIDTDLVRGHRTLIYEYAIALENNKNGGVGYKKYIYSSVPSGEKGKIWIDPETSRVLRIQFDLTGIPSSFPVRAFESKIEFDWVEIAGEKYLLPISSSAIFTTTSEIGLLQSRNLIRFKDYQKFGTEIIIVDDDDEIIEGKP